MITSQIAPKEMLFDVVFPLQNSELGTLFESQKELAEAIANDKKSPYYKKDVSLKPFLSQALKAGNDPQGKPLPNQLRDEIIKVCVNKLADNAKLQALFKEKFMHSINAWKAMGAEDKINRDTWESLLSWQNKTHAFIFTHSPIELEWKTNQKAYKLIETLYASALRNPERAKCSYKFFFPNEIIAMEFWSGLYLFLRKTMEVEEITELLERAWEAKSLRVYATLGELYEFHVSYFETRENDKILDSALFFLELKDNHEISVCKLTDEHRKYWYSNKFNKIVHFIDESPNIVKVKFKPSFALNNLF